MDQLIQEHHIVADLSKNAISVFLHRCFTVDTFEAYTNVSQFERKEPFTVGFVEIVLVHRG